MGQHATDSSYGVCIWFMWFMIGDQIRHRQCDCGCVVVMMCFRLGFVCSVLVWTV